MIIKPDARIVPTPDEFQAWTEHPTTRYIAAAWQAAAEAQREAWSVTSWGTGTADSATLQEFRTRADAYMAFLETGLDAYVSAIENR